MKKALKDKNGIYKCSDVRILFIIYIIEIIHSKTNKSLDEIYNALVDTKVYNYLIKNYEVLHTQDIVWVAEDTLKFIKERGTQI
ncbi:MAG: DUF3791 domain-containing protein [Oscillospiraceae bacterium]|nr:DUF3791 domain-containing protein [Oscillospiraceae bacterium]